MPFLSQEETRQLGFKSLGEGVKISSLASFYYPESIEIGDNSRIDDFCVLSGKIKIGCNVHIAVHCSISGGKHGILFDDFSGLAYGCHVFAQSDDYSGNSLTNPTIPDHFKKLSGGKIHLGKHVIVGAGSIIFPGVDINEGCAIGSMTMVTKSTKPWHIYFGIPARAIKKRSRNLLDLESEFKNKK
tara:strand:+ start:1095 stop:1652 length:558 start_codon:yes stop_codon:yes gene_type:complete